MKRTFYSKARIVLLLEEISLTKYKLKSHMKNKYREVYILFFYKYIDRFILPFQALSRSAFGNMHQMYV